jgi:sugar phosphate isomerase/epimerase
MFGISTFCLNEESLTAALEKIAPLTDNIEVMDEGLHYLETAEPLLCYSRQFSIHSPCRGTNIASLLEPIRRASVEVMAQCFAIAAEVGASVVVHPGYFAWAPERDKAIRQLQTSRAELTRLAEEHSITYFIENMGNWEYFLIKTPDELPVLGTTGFALDVGHAHQNHCLTEFLTHPAQHYHLHDNDGKEDAHMAVGDGTIDFNAVMHAVKKSGVTPVIEVATFEGVEKSIRRLKHFV